MERQFVTENTKERERLEKLVKSLTDDELKSVIYKEGWTIAAALGHLAFWDQIGVGVLRKWREKGVISEPSMDVDILNDALMRLFLALPPRAIAELAVTSAEAADGEVARSTTEFIQAIESSKEPPYRLNRGFHRKMHLDEIDAFLKTKRGKK